MVSNNIKKTLLCLFNSLLFFLVILNFGCNNNIDSTSNNEMELSNQLKDNLQNLNGEWAFKNDKEDENWWLQICFDSNKMQGTFILSQKYDSWGQNSNSKINIIDRGSFNLIEGYDMYKDKSYEGKNSSSGSTVFVITNLENPYSTDWHLRLRAIEDQMFGKYMTKVSNTCK
jgi:hypothetical protein